MGSVSMMNSLDRFIEAHGPDLTAAAFAGLPESIRMLRPVLDLVNEASRIGLHATWTLPGGSVEGIELRSIDPYEAAAIDSDDYGSDCDMGW